MIQVLSSMDIFCFLRTRIRKSLAGYLENCVLTIIEQSSIPLHPERNNMHTKFNHIVSSVRRALVLSAILLLTTAVFASKEEKKDASGGKNSSVAIGTASWYGGSFHGKKTATGDKFDLNKFTCASNRYPLGTWLRVTNIRNGKSVLVRVNDRMHVRMKRIVDLSKGAAGEIGMISAGVAKVKVEELGPSLPGTLP